MSAVRFMPRAIAAILCALSIVAMGAGLIGLLGPSNFQRFKSSALVSGMEDIRRGKMPEMPSDSELAAESLHADARSVAFILCGIGMAVIAVGSLVVPPAIRRDEASMPILGSRPTSPAFLGPSRIAGESEEDWAKRVADEEAKVFRARTRR